MNSILALILGLVLLVGGGELLVRGAVRIAEHLRLSPMLIGLTIVGIGTSTPELAASVQAALVGSPGIAVGNIVGSNIANLLLILGAAALLSPLAVERGVLWRDGGVGIAAVLALIVAGWTVGLGRVAGAAFVAGL
ncbi:MAG: sodium:calcium antiporter, partial [Porphyrobacter sp.]|nr:sodium:calcium antiporter [Porphyrobacter sp.]